MEYEIRSEETVTEAVIEAVSLSENCSPRDLPAIYGTINTDALNNIFEPIGENPADSQPGAIVFEYMDYCITVFSTGVIEVEPITKQILVEQ